MSSWMGLAKDRSVVARALKFALIVGPVLILINHAPALLDGDCDSDRVCSIGLTILVPYVVSTFSSVAAIQKLSDPPEISAPRLVIPK